jgi:transposase-like protein
MVAAVRKGETIYEVAKQFGVARATVRRWVARAAAQRRDRVDWSDHKPGRRLPVNKTKSHLESLILRVRKELKDHSALGEYGAAAIHRELLGRRLPDVPTIRTIGRILERRGALDGRPRVRRPPPPRGWYLPEVAASQAELDSFDIVEGLVIQGGYDVEVLTGMSLQGGLATAWVRRVITAKITVRALVEHWQRFGLPAYAQFDNDTVFQGAHHHPDSIGRVTRLCLSLEIVPVFTPPRETGFQAAIENFNGRWQTKVWNRFTHPSRQALQAQSAKFITACRQRAAARIEVAPSRRPFPESWTLDLQAAPQGSLVFLRRTTPNGQAAILGHTFPVDPHWQGRLVRAVVDLDAHFIRFHALRRRDPEYQPILKEVSYEFPKRKFQE